MGAIHIIGWIIGGLVIAALIIFLFRQLWNWLMPNVFNNAKRITYLQAFGLLLLAKILFGGFAGLGGWRHHGYWGREGNACHVKTWSSADKSGNNCWDWQQSKKIDVKSL